MGEGDAAGQRVALGGRRARVALAALALADGPVSAGRLAAILWSDQPPPTWPTAQRGMVRGLRAALTEIGAGGQRVIATTPAGRLRARAWRDGSRAAAQIRARGDRPGPPTLRAAVDRARSDAGLTPATRSAAAAGAGDDPALDVRAAADLVIAAPGPAEIGAISQSAAST
jgi:hypothetical protein